MRKDILQNNFVKVLIIILVLIIISFIGFLAGYAYIARDLVGVLRLETWQNFIYELWNFFS